MCPALKIVENENDRIRFINTVEKTNKSCLEISIEAYNELANESNQIKNDTSLESLKKLLLDFFEEGEKLINKRFIDYKISKIIDTGSSIEEFISNSLKSMIILDWAKNKQVYKITKELYLSLLNTDNKVLYKSCLDHLPCNTFYVDLSNIKIDLHGIMIDCSKSSSNNYVVTIIEVSDNGKTKNILSYSCYDLENKGEIDININSLKYFKNKELYIMALTFLNYIGSSNPDIIENKDSKRTYKPNKHSEPKNKFCEVQTWDVGIKYAKDIKRKRYVNEYSSGTGTSSHKRPHFRKAHWHRFWTGKRGTEERRLITKWIEPIYVGDPEYYDTIIHVKK